MRHTRAAVTRRLAGVPSWPVAEQEFCSRKKQSGKSPLLQQHTGYEFDAGCSRPAKVDSARALRTVEDHGMNARILRFVQKVREAPPTPGMSISGSHFHLFFANHKRIGREFRLRLSRTCKQRRRRFPVCGLRPVFMGNGIETLAGKKEMSLYIRTNAMRALASLPALGHEYQRSGINAVSLSSRRRAVVENVTQMVPRLIQHFYARLTDKTVVPAKHNGV